MADEKDGWHRLAAGKFVQSLGPWFIGFELPFKVEEALLTINMQVSVLDPIGGTIRLIVDGMQMGLYQITRQSEVAQDVDLSFRWQEPRRDERRSHMAVLETEGVVWLSQAHLQAKIPENVALSVGLL